MHQFEPQQLETGTIGTHEAVDVLDACAASFGAIERTGSAALLRSLLRLRDRLDECLHDVVAHFEASSGYQHDGTVSTTAWLIIHGGLTRRQAGSLATTARRLRSLPHTAAAWADGTLTSGHVNAITAKLSNAAPGVLTDREAELVPLMANLTVPQAEHAMRHWRAAADATQEDTEPPEPEATVQLSRGLDDGWWLTGRLDDETGALLDKGLGTRPLWNALVLRDHQCRFPGCNRRAGWCDGHHVRHWLDGGATELENLVMLCGHHHRVLHRPGWHAKLLPDATLEITARSGDVITSRLPPAPGTLPLPSARATAAALA